MPPYNIIIKNQSKIYDNQKKSLNTLWDIQAVNHYKKTAVLSRQYRCKDRDKK